MRNYIVTEGQIDATILKTLLFSSLAEQTIFVPAAGRYGAESMARTLLAVRQQPVALVIDADTNDSQSVQELNQIVYQLLNQVSPGIPFEVLVAVPEIEAILFHSRPLIESIVGRQFNESEWEFALHSPKTTLSELTGMENPAAVEFILNRLSDEDIETLREHPVIKGLHEFLARVMTETQESL